MFDNEKIYINHIKTVTHIKNRTSKKLPPRSGYVFGIAASVYGKLTNCFFGGSVPKGTFAISQPGKGTLFENCCYTSDCNGTGVVGTVCSNELVGSAADYLNDNLKKAAEASDIDKENLCKWEACGKNTVLIKKLPPVNKEKGDGSRENPFIINTADDFIEFTNSINSINSYEGKYFLQNADIDLSSRTDYNGANGSGVPYIFAGVYDGAGHTINVALDTSDSKTNNTVFPYTTGIIMNTGVTGTILGGGRYTSGFARSVQKNGCIVNCFSNVHISLNLPTDTGFELRYTLSGSSTIKYGMDIFEISPGTVLYLPKIPGISDMYTEEIHEPISSISIYFDTDFTLTKSIFVCDCTGTKEVETLFEKMYATWLGRKSKYYLDCMAMIYEIIAKLSKPTGNYLPKDKYMKIEKGVTYLFNNCFSKDIDFYYPAELCGISYTYFKQLFIQKYEKAPKQHIMHLRMERALELLNTGSVSITEIADRCGFENVYYFSKAFKKHFGMSPKNYMPV